MIKKNYSELFEFTTAQMATLKKEYEPLRGKTISVPNAKKMNIMLDRFSKDILTKLANADIPFISMGAASKLVMKHGMKFTDFKLNMSEADELQCEACWTGYKQVGMKKKGDRQVPNCVKEEDLKEMIGEVNDLRGSFSDAQLERMKQDWKNKSASAMTSSIKQTIMNMDAPTRAALKGAGINHISKFANSTLEEVEIEESMVQRVMQTIHDKLKKEGGAAGFDDIAKEVKKEFGITLQKSSLDNMPGVKKHRDGDYILEADLSKSQVKMVHKKADDMPKKDFMKRYGKDGDSVRYATATNMVKKKLGIEEEQYVPEQTQPKGEEVMNESYKDKFNATMKKFGINSLGDLKSDEEKKKFFKAVDNAHVAKNEELEEEDAYDNERFIIIDGKAKKDDGNTPDKKDHVYAPDAKTALQLHKQGKKVYRESVDPSCSICEGEACQCAQAPSDTESVSEMSMNAMKMNAMKMPIRATYGKMNAMKTGDDDMTPMNNMKLNAMVKDPHKSKKDDPKKDMNAGYMKSDVRADVKNNGGADMAKVKDKPQMMPAMKKINAMYKTEKYLDEKEGSIQNTVAQMFEAENRLVEVQDKNLEKMIADYLKKGGTITKLPPALAKGMKASGQSTFKVGDKGIIKSMYKMKEVREFVDTYNRHFLLNYKAEELLKNNINEAKFKYEMDIDTGARTQLVYGEISANTESEAQKKYDKLEADMEKKHRNATIEGGVFDGKNTTTTTGRGTATRKNI